MKKINDSKMSKAALNSMTPAQLKALEVRLRLMSRNRGVLLTKVKHPTRGSLFFVTKGKKELSARGGLGYLQLIKFLYAL